MKLKIGDFEITPEGWQTGFEPATAGTTIRPLLAAAPTNPA
jgi:hypothetical protein